MEANLGLSRKNFTKQPRSLLRSSNAQNAVELTREKDLGAKKSNLVSEMKANAKFLRVRCTGCGNEQLVYSHASTVVRCRVCEKTLAIPHGGKAELKGVVLGAVS